MTLIPNDLLKIFAKTEEDRTRVNHEHMDIAERRIGMLGRMLSATKEAPKNQKVFFNANIFNSNMEKIWFGDINLTKEDASLSALAKDVGKIYVTKEQPFRLKGLANYLDDPLYEDSIVAIGPDF